MTPRLLALAAATAVTFAGATLAGAPFPSGGRPDADHGRTPAQQQPPAPQQPAAKPVTSVSTEIMILHGLNDGSGIDPKIGNIPALSKPPFSSYNSYKLLDRASASLDKGKNSTTRLPTGRELQITFKDVIEPLKPGDPRRFIIDASIQKPDGKAFLPQVEVSAKAGEWFFVGGQEYKGGALLIGIRVVQ